MTISEIVRKHMLRGFARAVAQNLAAEEIFLSKLAKSDLAENATLKGGIVMYSLTRNERRATRDIDFDFIRYSIDEESVRLFIERMNRKDDGFAIAVHGPINKLHQQDYEGVRVNVAITDRAGGLLRLKLDIGVHKHLEIKQTKLLFMTETGETVSLLVNTPEQVFAEKCLSLGRLGPVSTRYKDVYDLYYLVNTGIDPKKVRSILSTFIEGATRPPHDLRRLKANIFKALDDPDFSLEAQSAKNRWLDADYREIVESLKVFLGKCAPEE